LSAASARIYCAATKTIDAVGTETEFTSSAGTLTAQVLNLRRHGSHQRDEHDVLIRAWWSSMHRPTPRATGACLLPSATAITVGTEVHRGIRRQADGEAPTQDMTLQLVQVAAQYAGGT